MAMGQGLSALICGTAITSQYLAEDFHVNTPMLQSFMNYALLCFTYTTTLALRKASNILLGDGLVLVSAALYAMSNVCQEYTVKNRSRMEFLGMVGLFGTLISSIQLAILEHKDVTKIEWNWKIGLLFAAYALCMFTLYSFMPVVIKMSSATAVNLSLLTADLFSLFCGLFLFHYTFSGLYIVSFVVITIGFVMFNAVPTITLAPASSQGNDGGLSNHALDADDDIRQETAVELHSEEGKRKEDSKEEDSKNSTNASGIAATSSTPDTNPLF
ncbi:hypothetical protein MATL_G00119130 [Megalops atlanticus]|uniref:Solute carrier family 35 member F2 n=1 Tax=Megalops atlanticus TaxID=7932 RepID=A0A9D3T4T3_MEGAT|nr:hypothetical protein MATL_G00119130 [Megalops atlanticus]